MSSSKPERLKRLSLLQSPNPLFSPASSSFGSRRDASKRFSLPNELAGASALLSPATSVSSPTTDTRPGHASARKNARRQSSIYYVSQDREVERVTRETRSPVDELGFSSLQNDANNDKVGSEAKPKRRSLSAIDETVPLTLAEKHADLLQFIAQKESRCLELRSQLATEEAELLALKRKWERIINRRIKGESSASASSLDTEPSAQGNVLNGLREGVQGVGRLIAHLSDLGTQNRETDPGHASNSSISTVVTSSSMGLSQSSVSSLGTIDDGDLPDRTDVRAGSSDLCAKQQSISTPVRRRPYEPSSPGMPSPPILTPQTPYSPSYAHTQIAPPKPSHSHSTASNETERRHAKRRSIASGSLPPASSIPGISVVPLTSWVEGISKRIIGQVVSGSDTRFNSAKRASISLSDGSNAAQSSFTSPIHPSRPGARVIDLSAPDSPSLLDDDDGSGAQCAGITMLSPERLVSAPASTASFSPQWGHSKDLNGNGLKGSAEITRTSDDDSEEWNW